MVIQGSAHGSHYGTAVVGPPDDEEVEDCRNFGRRTAKLVKRLFA